MIRKRHHSGYFNALDLCCPLSGAPSVTGLWCQVTLADDFHLFLIVEQGHVWSGYAVRGTDCGQEGGSGSGLSLPHTQCALRQSHGPGSEALRQPARMRARGPFFPPQPLLFPPQTTPETSTLFCHCNDKCHLGKFFEHLEQLSINGRMHYWPIKQLINSCIKNYLYTCY